MHSTAYQFVYQMLATYGQPESVVEIGSCNVNGTIRPLFKRAEALGCYVGVDVRSGPGVDIVSDGASYQPSPGRFTFGIAMIVCCEVLEHAPNAHQIVKNAIALLRPGGFFVLTCATDPRPRHTSDGAFGGNEHYHNICPKELTSWLQQTRVSSFAVTTSPALGDLYAWAEK